jgi:hypothetical protein
MTAFALPFDFDTHRETRLVLKGVIGLLVLMLVFAMVMLFARHDVRGAAGTLLIDAVLLGFGHVVRVRMTGAEGRVTRDAVQLRAGRVWGIALPGPVGTFALHDFRAVQVRYHLDTLNDAAPSTRFEHVTLLGRHGTPDVCVLRAPRVRGASRGEALAEVLGLPCEPAKH